MLSRVAGNLYGTAKKTKPIMVRYPYPRTVEQELEGVSRALTRLDTNGGAKTVLLMATYWPLSIVNPAWIKRLRYLLTEIESKGVFIVTGSGNGGLVSFFFTNNFAYKIFILVMPLC